jgi:hypothetical protein
MCVSICLQGAPLEPLAAAYAAALDAGLGVLQGQVVEAAAGAGEGAWQQVLEQLEPVQV